RPDARRFPDAGRQQNQRERAARPPVFLFSPGLFRESAAVAEQERGGRDRQRRQTDGGGGAGRVVADRLLEIVGAAADDRHGVADALGDLVIEARRLVAGTAPCGRAALRRDATQRRHLAAERLDIAVD